jgi:hypothetical protein
VSDARLTSAGPARFQYELDDEGKIKTNADGTWSVWLRDEKGEWQAWMDLKFTKIRA